MHRSTSQLTSSPESRLNTYPLPRQHNRSLLTKTRNVILTGLLTTLASAFVGGVKSSYRSWQATELNHIKQGGNLIETAVGPVEYQVTGKGPAVIYAHGTPGGYDQGIAFARFISQGHYTFISPSRPGYLRTPLESGASPEGQADMYAALLDALEIKTASVIGFSGGGPSAIQFALRHPDRCHSLVMIGGIVQRHMGLEKLKTLPFWQRLPAELVEYLLISEPFLYIANPIARLLPSGDTVAGMLNSGAHFNLRKAGYINDRAQFAALEDYPLEQISAPTLVIHGIADSDVPLEDALLLARKIPKVTLLAVSGDHSSFYTQARTIMPALREFLL